MPHVELSLSEPQVSRPRPPARSSLALWADAVAEAEEASLVIDVDTVIVALSPPCNDMLGLDRSAVGMDLLDVLLLLDFSAGGAALSQSEVDKIPPLLALSSGRLARGLLRVRCLDGPCTLDAVATPLLAAGRTAGSLTFFSLI